MQNLIAFRMRSSVLVAAVVSCLIAGSYALAQFDQPDKAPKPGTWEFARQEGRRLLLAGRWKEAAEAYGICSGDLLGDVKTVGWNSVRDKPQPEQDRFRFALLTFYFRNMNFSQGGWRYGAREVVEYGRRYREIAARHPSCVGLVPRPTLRLVPLDRWADWLQDLLGRPDLDLSLDGRPGLRLQAGLRQGLAALDAFFARL